MFFFCFFFFIKKPSAGHHHQVPPTSSRSAIMDLQLFRYSALYTSIIGVHYRCPNHSFHLYVSLVPLFPSTLPSSNNFWIDLALITCLKYWHFFFFIVGNNELVVFAIFNASSLVLCSVNDYILLTFFYTPSSQKPLILYFPCQFGQIPCFTTI